MISVLNGFIYLSLLNVWIFPNWCEMNDFYLCHDDFSLKPTDGLLNEYTFPWLGFAQYLHEVTELLHPKRAPRVVLIHKQFVLTTARDMLNLPKHYKLGNMIFGEYEREGKDCGLTSEDIMMGKRCPRAYIEMPFLEILPHPEFSRFGVNNSVALVLLLREMKSHFMLPACLPTLQERAIKKTLNTVFLIDYISAVPEDFDFEKMGKRTLKLFKGSDCRRHEKVADNKSLSQFFCSSGCGVRPGAPIIIHASDGRFELVGLAVGGSRCKDQGMRTRFNDNPPFYIDVYPFVPWIINVINAHRIPKPYPQHFKMLEAGTRIGARRSTPRNLKSGWKGRIYFLGDNCFGGWKIRKQVSFFYEEKFEARADSGAPDSLPRTLSITVKISAGMECVNVCYRILLPHRLITPQAKLESMIFTLNMDILAFSKSFYFTIGISGTNASAEIYEERKNKHAPIITNI